MKDEKEIRKTKKWKRKEKRKYPYRRKTLLQVQPRLETAREKET